MSQATIDQTPIQCRICGGQIHAVKTHLERDHKDWTVERYQQEYPDAPMLSEFMKAKIAERKRELSGEAPAEAARTEMAEAVPLSLPATKRPFHEVFGLDADKKTLSAKGKPIPINVFAPHSQQDYVPAIDEGYVFDPEELKDVVLGFELDMPVFVWGHKGSGKTELFEQVCARTNRPLLRVQHTVNTEESHIVGQWTVKGGHTVFELGPLPMAMLNGWTYLADEYDFGLPNVLSVYQPVLEGKPLVIKEADAANRIVRPHPNFRFVATGNTNGSGDETGLYQGTSIQNSANFDRFGVTIHKKYMSEKDEIRILRQKAGLVEDDAKKLAQFARQVREAYDGSKISDIISPRALINGARLGVSKASFSKGIALAFTNKLSKVDQAVVNGLAQRIFGA